ncbi:MAG: CARDB domain-containing protein [Euryarchaeota archaeon]|nr:CARDB domain-containing protein [Euryarchaeota archaeon]
MNTNPFRKSVYGKTASRKNVILVTAIAAVFLIAAIGSASAADCSNAIGGPGSCNCGDTVVGDYTFTADLTCTDNTKDGLSIGANDIVIDGNGFKITGNENYTSCVGSGESFPGGTHCGIRNPGFDNVVIRNLQIENFCTGVCLVGSPANPVETNTVEKCVVHDNGNATGGTSTHGIHAMYTKYSTITKNEIYSNTGIGGGCGSGGNGIFIYGGGVAGGPATMYNNITCNNIHNNRKAGIFMKRGAGKQYNTFAYNRVWENGVTGLMPFMTGGIILRCKSTHKNTIAYNNVADNTGEGIFIGANWNTIKYNTVISNTDNGINMGRSDAGDNNTVSNNCACSNGGKDINCHPNRQDNFGVNNTCDNCTCGPPNNAIFCNFTCANPVSVYFDFDVDGYYSNTPENCVCGICGGAGQCACCNPGLFNSSGANDHCAGGVCQLAPGDDPNDCCKPNKPDLVINHKYETWIEEGQTYNITYNVCNIGCVGAGASKTRVMIDGTPHPPPGNVPALAPNECFTQTLEGPYTCSGDNDTIKLCADGPGWIDEIDETNNCIENVLVCGPPPEPDLVIKDIRPVRWCCCCIEAEPIRTVKGGDDSEKMQVMFIDDPELAKELGDDKLREEVAEALAKDPKLAAEIAVKLAGDDEKRAKELSRDPKQLAELCCYRCNVVKELADLLDTELTAEQQHEMSDSLDEIVGCGCCCCCKCCCGRFIAYKIANVGDAEASWSLSNLTVNGRVRSVDIVRPLDAGQSRWEIFPCYRMWWWPWHHEVTVCADVTDWVAESDETNNCRTEWWPWVRPKPTSRPTLKPMPIAKPDNPMMER